MKGGFTYIHAASSLAEMVDVLKATASATNLPNLQGPKALITRMMIDSGHPRRVGASLLS